MDLKSQPLTIIEGSQFLRSQRRQARRRYLRLLASSLLFGTGGTLLLLVGVIGGFLGLSWPLRLLLLLCGGAAVAAADRSSRWLAGGRRYSERFGRGVVGERRMVQALQQQLDGRWTLLRNLVIGDGDGDIDGVLLGPRGVYVLEVKNLSGRHRYSGERWHVFRSRWQPQRFHAGKQALENAQRVRRLLQGAGLGVNVWPRLVWAGEDWLELHENDVPVWFTRSAVMISADLRRQPRHDAAVIAQVRALLLDSMREHAA